MGKQTSSIRWWFWRRARPADPAAAFDASLSEASPTFLGRTGIGPAPETLLAPRTAPAAAGGVSLRIDKAAPVHGCAPNSDSAARMRYLLDRENGVEEIHKLDLLLRMPRVLLEIGCGSADAARQIALKNPDMAVIATDRYGGAGPAACGSGYGKIARAWRERRLSAQAIPAANLVILRAEADLLACLPERSVDSVLLLNPEPSVGRLFLARARERDFSVRIKHGSRRIVILPYSREMGLAACGGCGFEHDPDWSRGLGFIMASGLMFRTASPVQWGVDLSVISAYTRSSTQRQVYVWGDDGSMGQGR